MVPIRGYARPRTVLVPLCEGVCEPKLYESALDLYVSTGYGFYDSLIVAAALKGECDTLYTEDMPEGECDTLFTVDMQDGREMFGLTIVNPFAR